MPIRARARTLAAATIGLLASLAATLPFATHATAQMGTVVVNEFVAANATGLLDEDGETSDWVELHNTTGAAISLDGWHLTDDLGLPDKWAFPTTTIAAGEHLVVFASGKDRAIAGSELHTNFQLDKAGDTIAVMRPDLTVESAVQFTQQFDDVSAGPRPAGGVYFYDPPTPGAPNGAPLVGFGLPLPTFTPERGIFDGPVNVTITTTEPGATVRYTTDGSIPDGNSPVAAGPLLVDTSTTLRAATFTAGGVSDAATSSYVMIDEVIAQPEMDPQVTQSAQYGPRMEGSLLQVPTIYLTMDGTPIDAGYQAVSMEWMDAAETFQIDAGIKIYGGASINDAKKNYRLKFSDEFGPSSLDFDFFENHAIGAALGIVPASRHDQIELRAGGGDSNLRTRTHALWIRSSVADDFMLSMGVPNTHNRFVQVFLNGEYRGAYTLRERFDADFMANYFGGTDDDYDAINKNAAFDGTAATWDAMRANPTWNHLSTHLDTDAFVDYMIYNFWAATRDWTANKNWATAGPSDQASPVGWLANNKDPDHTMGRSMGVTYNNTLADGPGALWSGLIADDHPDFIQAVTDSIGRHLFNDGALTPDPIRSLVDNRADAAHELLVADAARWGTCNNFCAARDQPLWDPDDEWLTHLTWVRDVWIPQRTDIALDQFRANGWLPVEPPTITNCCDVVAGDSVSLGTADGPGTIVYTTDGSDPRLPGGAVNPAAVSASNVTSTDIAVFQPTRLTFRVLRNGAWSPLAISDIAVVGSAAPLILNEWNAVSGSSVLAGSDPLFGRVPGNGGDWFELVVTQDHLDIRGWSLDISTDGVPRNSLTFGNDPLLADLRAGTIVTVSEQAAEDVSYAPRLRDWNINVRAGADGTGQFISAENFIVDENDWQLTIRAASGVPVFGPAGEGITPVSGITGSEIGELEAHPSALITPLDAYDDGSSSTFGLANEFGGVTQDFSSLRTVLPRGDVNCDDRVDVVDALMIAQAAVGNRVEGPCPLANPAGELWASNGDTNEDGTTDIIDSLLIAQCTVGIDNPTCLPPVS